MKRIVLLTATIILLFSISAAAQKDSWMIYASGGYDNVRYFYNNNNSYSYITTPIWLVGWDMYLGIGWQLSNHLMVGVQGVWQRR